jgi:hypothetical protein
LCRLFQTCHNRSLAGQQGISSPVSLLAGLLAGLFSHLRGQQGISSPASLLTGLLMNPIGQLTNIRRSDGAPEPDGVLKVVVRKKIIHYRQLYIDHPEPIVFMPVAVDTSARIYDDFLRLLFLHTHREASALTNDIPGGIRSFSCPSPCLFI